MKKKNSSLGDWGQMGAKPFPPVPEHCSSPVTSTTQEGFQMTGKQSLQPFSPFCFSLWRKEKKQSLKHCQVQHPQACVDGGVSSVVHFIGRKERENKTFKMMESDTERYPGEWSKGTTEKNGTKALLERLRCVLSPAKLACPSVCAGKPVQFNILCGPFSVDPNLIKHCNV